MLYQFLLIWSFLTFVLGYIVQQNKLLRRKADFLYLGGTLLDDCLTTDLQLFDKLEFFKNFDQKIRWPWDSYWILKESIWWNTVLVSRCHQILQDFLSENLLTSEFLESFDQNLRWPSGKPIRWLWNSSRILSDFRFEISGCSTLVQTHQITWGKKPSNCTRTFSNKGHKALIL